MSTPELQKHNFSTTSTHVLKDLEIKRLNLAQNTASSLSLLEVGVCGGQREQQIHPPCWLVCPAMLSTDVCFEDRSFLQRYGGGDGQR